MEYARNRKKIVANADREVILAGGVINSPQLLMLSGIGDAAELAYHDIATEKSLPGVGKNLQDHVSAILMYHRKEPGPFHHMMRADRIGRELARAYIFGTGFASDVPGTLSLLAFPQGVGYPYPRDVVIGKDLTVHAIRNSFDVVEMDALVERLLRE